jgi:hypothetical protein
MKKLHLYLLLFVSFALVSFSSKISENLENKDPVSKVKRYGIEQACIESEIKSQFQTGTEALYFDDWGAREAKYTTMKIKVPGMTQETHTATFLEGTSIYTVDLDNNTGTVAENPMLKELEGKNMQEVGDQMMIKMGGKKVGTEKFLGKMCEVWEYSNLGTKSLVWKGIPLKTETNMMGQKMTITATKLEFSYDKKKLNRPDIKYNEAGDMLKKIEDLQKGFRKN